MDLLAILNEQYSYVCIVAVIITIIALVVSTKYALKNFLRTRSGKLSQKMSEIPVSSPSTADDLDQDSIDNDLDGDKKMTTSTGHNIVCSERYPDPVDFCEHIQGEIKRVQQSVATKSIAKNLTEEQLEEERKVQQKQLAEIYKLMQEQQDRFGIGSMEDMQEQMRLYAV
ncbi:uncharacterized protein LOC131940751 [Physella acuta]|uniref:uncharacterized protein LOC131940751 n=1 Tax=Physella acuta TaxID=109671 RepID=UPI0027DD3585|nr:uncharacterized protein LOC131940751 [Physella acuta]